MNLEQHDRKNDDTFQWKTANTIQLLSIAAKPFLQLL